MIDLERLANRLDDMGIMHKSFHSMSKEEILMLCWAVVESQDVQSVVEQGKYPHMAPCIKHGGWWVYRKNCNKCEMEVCPAWTD